MGAGNRIRWVLAWPFALAIVLAFPARAQWAAEPGATVVNAFGPASGLSANTCRGACGGGCPSTCERTVVYECEGEAQLRRVVIFDCGTHAACRVHDDCLDTCVQAGGQAGSQDCQSRCDASIVEDYGAGPAAAWLLGQGPYDGRVVFKYTQDAPGAPQAAYQCPAGTQRQCAGDTGCVAGNGQLYEPFFGGYPEAPAGAMQVSAFRTGKVCDDHVCTYAIDIPVSGADDCAGKRCTRFGVEFDYRNADPGAPLECRTSTLGEEGDFVNTLLKQGADTMTSRSGQGQGQTETGKKQEGGMGELVGLFGKVLASGDSTEDVDVSITPLDKDGNPIESERVGSAPIDGPPPVPRSIDLPASSGHLLIPMYQTSSGLSPGVVKEKRVMCSHKGQPVLEATFRLRAA